MTITARSALTMPATPTAPCAAPRASASPIGGLVGPDPKQEARLRRRLEAMAQLELFGADIDLGRRP